MRVAAELLGAERDVAFAYPEWYPKNLFCLCWRSGEILLLLVPWWLPSQCNGRSDGMTFNSVLKGQGKKDR